MKDNRFQEASLEFRNAIQIDDKLAAAHWGLARAYEGMQRGPEMIDELRKTVDLDANNLDARVKLGNYYIFASGGKSENIDEADRLVGEILSERSKEYRRSYPKGFGALCSWEEGRG